MSLPILNLIILHLLVQRLLIFLSDLNPLLISIRRLSLKNLEVLFLILLSVTDEDDLAHVFAVGISEKALLDLVSGGGGGYALGVDKVPEANCSVAGAGGEPGQARLVV